MRILLVEDDESIGQMLCQALTDRHYLVDLATDGQAGWELAEALEYDLILLDLMLPRLDGISFCKRRRQKHDRTPILLLTAQEVSTNKVAGLDAGADDYVVKPFDLQELLARIRALLRRGSMPVSPVIEWGSLHLDSSKCQVTYDGQLLRLTAKEYALLELFLRHNHRIFSQSSLLDHLWSFDECPSENTVRAHIKSLRSKLKKAGAPADLIETIYGLGYRLKSRESEAARQEGSEEGEIRSLPPNRGLEEEIGGLTSQKPLSKEQISQGLAAVWEKFKQKYSDRVTVLARAVKALRENTFSEELQCQAHRQAHTLKGSLGSFGFAEASRLSAEIEQMFQAESRLSKQEVEHLSRLVVALRQELEQQPTMEPSVPQVATFRQQSQLLIVDNDTELAERLVLEAKARGMQAQVACDLWKVREAMVCNQPDIVLLDLCFPDSTENGFKLLAELAAQAPLVPVLVFTAQESFTDRVKVARLGGRGFLHKSLSPEQVMDAIVQVLQQSSKPEAKLLVVDDDPQLLDFLRTLLEPWGFRLTLLDDPQQFWDMLEQSTPDLLILDVEMPNFSGIDLCQVVRNEPRWSELPVLFLSANTDAEIINRVFSAGADDYVSKPIVGSELIARVLNRLERTQILRRLQKLTV